MRMRALMRHWLPRLMPMLSWPRSSGSGRDSPPPSPPSAQILFHAGRRRLGIGAAAADHGASEVAQRERHLGRLRRHGDAAEHQRAVDHERAFAREQQHWQPPGRDDDLRALRHQRTNLLDEIGADLRVARLVGEGAHEAGQVDMDRAHAREALIEPVRVDLALVPVNEYGSMVTSPNRRPMLSAASRLASPNPTTGMSRVPRISKRPGSWKCPT